LDVYLVDGTYELFRHFYALPPYANRTGEEVAAIRGVLGSVAGMLESGATHIGVATDHVIESFRNDMWPGYKSSAGMPPDLLAQFPVAEQAIEALGLVLWPMVEWEADDAIAAAAVRFAAHPAVERILICTPDKDMAQLVQDDRVVLWDRRRDLTYDEPGVRAKWGVGPASIPDWLALVGDSSDGYPGLPGWGAKSAATILARYESLDAIPRKASEWDVRVPGAVRLAAVLVDHWDTVMLYRDLARLRVADDGVVIPQTDPDQLRWQGADRGAWQAFCDRWGIARLRERPHLWRTGT